MVTIYIINKIVEKSAPKLFVNAKSNTQIITAGMSKIFYESTLLSCELLIISGLVGGFIWLKNKKKDKSCENTLNDISIKNKKYERTLGFLMNSFSYAWLISILRTGLSIKKKNIKIIKFL